MKNKLRSIATKYKHAFWHIILFESSRFRIFFSSSTSNSILLGIFFIVIKIFVLTIKLIL